MLIRSLGGCWSQSMEQWRKNKCYSTANIFLPWRNSPSRRTAEVRRDQWKQSTGTAQGSDSSAQDPVQPHSAYLQGWRLHTLSGQPRVSDHPCSRNFLLNGCVNGVPCISIGAHCTWRGRGSCLGGF